MSVLNTTRKLMALLAALALIAGPCAPQSASNSPAAAQEKTPDAAKPNPARARKELEAGKRAEKSGDWQTAYEDYADALADAPGNKDAELLRDAARFRLVQQHMEGAERELLTGNNPGAQTELRAAIALDPTYKTARERLAQVVAMDPPQQKTTAHERELAPPVKLHAESGTHTFDVRGDTQSVYAAVAQQFGIIAQFDSDLPPGRGIRFKVPDVNFETAMNVLAAETHTFWAPYDETRIIVADDQPAKRKQFEPLAVRTFVLPASLTDEEMTATLRVIREIVGITRTSLDVASRELTVRDSPKNIDLAAQLIDQIEQGRGELVLEVELLEVDRNAARDLGILPGTTANVIPLTTSEINQLQQAQSTQALTALIQSIFGSSGGGALGGLLPPLVAFGGGSSIFFSTLANTQANFSQTYSLVHSAQRLLLRAQDGKPATFFVGEHFPITLSLLSANIGNTVPGIPTRTDLQSGNAPSAVITASLRGNGQTDIIATNTTDGTISIFFGNGDGTFTRQLPDRKVGTAPVALVAEDFNGDGNIDLAVVNQGDNTVSILFNDGSNTGAFTGKTLPDEIIPTGKTPSAIVAADFNSDGHFDFAVTNFGDSTVSVFLNDNAGTGTFTAAGPAFSTGVDSGPHAIATADFNGDGVPDLAVVNQTAGNVAIFLGNASGTPLVGNGTFTEKAPSPYVTGSAPFGITIADFNGDGIQDLAVTNQNSNTISVFLANASATNTAIGDGTFQTPAITSATGNGPTGIVSGAFAAGSLDLIVANFADNTVSVLVPTASATGNGNGTGAFTSAFTIATATGPVALATSDFNGDSTPDLAVAAQTGNAISIILNSATLAANNQTTQTPYPGSEYEDIGLKVKATPRLHSGSEVTLQLSFEIRSLSGSNINGIPIISNRTVEQTVRVHENEPTLLAGLVDEQEALAISGWPGASQLGAAGYFIGDHNKNTTDNELLIIITPRLVHATPHSGKPIYAGRDTIRGGPGQP
jgi:type II secretory pathway component GspD/PulD (secretin)